MRFGKCRTAVAVALVSALLATPAGAGQGVRQGDARETTVETVFDWQRDHCAMNDIPDGPARAFRDAAGTVHLVSAHIETRAMIGPDLDHLRHDCAVLFRGGGSDRPDRFDDQSWLTSFYTVDGKTVAGLVHMEYWGNRRRDLCPSADYMRCWATAITAAISHDGGRTFQRATPPDNLVATVPYPYRGEIGHPVGFFTPSNIFAANGHYYALISATRYEAQAPGNCLIRTDDPTDWKSWRAWDGQDFTVRFINPYREAGFDPARHVCRPVGGSGLAGQVMSVVRHAPSNRFVAVFAGTIPAGAPGGPVQGVFLSVSSDLIAWSPPRLLYGAPILARENCTTAREVFYPALLDPASPARNFDVIGDHPWLYMTLLHVKDCKPTMVRDLVRVPVTIAP